MSHKPEPCIILGRKIGTYTGYHLIDMLLKVHNFVPDPSCPGIPSGEIVFDFDFGVIRAKDKTGEIDLIDVLTHAPKATEAELKGMGDPEPNKPPATPAASDQQTQPTTQSVVQNAASPSDKTSQETKNDENTQPDNTNTGTGSSAVSPPPLPKF